MHRSDNGQALMVNHNISSIETKIDYVNIQLRFIPTLHTQYHMCITPVYFS